MKYTAKKQNRQPKNKTVSFRKSQSGGALFGLFGNNSSETKTASDSNVNFNYKVFTLKYKEHPIVCEVCKTPSFYHLDTSVDRSKVLTGALDFFGESNANQYSSHPIRTYVCTTCYWCKMVYASTSWNKLPTMIVETPSRILPAPQKKAEGPVEENVPIVEPSKEIVEPLKPIG
jgi:hypothetical protein